jgi:hypothetical protein
MAEKESSRSAAANVVQISPPHYNESAEDKHDKSARLPLHTTPFFFLL